MTPVDDIKQIRDCSGHLSGSKWLLQYDASRNAFGYPLGDTITCYVNHCDTGKGASCVSGDFPSTWTTPKIYICENTRYFNIYINRGYSCKAVFCFNNGVSTVFQRGRQSSTNRCFVFNNQ